MDDQKKTYYIDIGSGEISQSATASSWNFKIEANNQEITELRRLFDENYSNEWKGFWRAHVPYVEYHHDSANDAYDSAVQQIYAQLYNLGDEDAKKHIESMNILPSQP